MIGFFRRLRARIRYRHHAEDLARELEIHRAMAEASAAGEPDTRRAVALQLGNVTLAREDARAVWVVRWFDSLRQDVTYALRTTRRQWGFAVTVTITFALGMGVLIGVFSVFNAIYFRLWPVRAPAEVFGTGMIERTPAATGGQAFWRGASYAVWADVERDMMSADLAAKYDLNGKLCPTADGQGRGGRVALVSDGFLDTIGIRLQFGTLSSNTGLPAIAITDALWTSFYGRDPAILGRSLFVNQQHAIITGVLEPRFRGFPPELSDGVMRLDQTGAWIAEAPDFMTNPKACCVDVLGRLRPGHTRGQAASELELRLNGRHASLGLPAVTVAAWDTAMASRPGGVRNTVPTLFALLFAGCGVVTLLACANIGNLHLAQGLRRSREVAMRLALGASRGRIVRQLLTEAVVLALLGMGGGLVIAWFVPPAILTIDTPSSLVVTPNAPVIVFAAGLAALVTLLSALAPALRVTRIDWRRAAANITPRAGGLGGVLLAAQVALSLGLIASAALLSRGVLKAAAGADAGFRFEDVSSMTIVGSTDGARTAVADALQALPDLALADEPPWSERTQRAHFHTSDGATEAIAFVFGFNRRADALLELPLVAGRWPIDDPRLKEAVITRTVANALWNRTDVLGRTILKVGEKSEDPYTVVGLMDEVRLADDAPHPTVVVTAHDRRSQSVLAGTGDDGRVKAVVMTVDPNARVQVTPLVAGLRQRLKNSFAGMGVASGLGSVALLLASLGIFGVFSYVVEERRREIGIRRALGASARQVRLSLAFTTRWPIAGGLAAGVALALLGGRLLRANLYGISLLDPLSYLAVAAILGLAAMVATWLPLRRALRVDPAIALKQE